MLKNIFFLLLVTIVISFSSCITSVNQLVTYDKVIVDNRMTGTWQQDNGSSVTIDEFFKSNFIKNVSKVSIGSQQSSTNFDSKEDSLLYSKSYVISYTKAGNTYYMTGSLMRLDNELYVDVFPLSVTNSLQPESHEMPELFNNPDYLPSHTIAKVNFTDSAIALKFLDGDFIKRQLAKGAIAVKYESDKLFNTAVITASSAEMQQFLVKYGNDERLYNTKNTITLKKI